MVKLILHCWENWSYTVFSLKYISLISTGRMGSNTHPMASLRSLRRQNQDVFHQPIFSRFFENKLTLHRSKPNSVRNHELSDQDICFKCLVTKIWGKIVSEIWEITFLLIHFFDIENIMVLREINWSYIEILMLENWNIKKWKIRKT